MSNHCEVVFWDVQHGHMTYIKTPNNRHIVIDLGTGDYSKGIENFSPLLHLKNKYKVNQLDYVIITHPHLDHIDDILNFDALKPRVLLRPNHLSNDEVMERVLERDRAKFEKYCEINNRYNQPIDPSSIDDKSNPSNWGGLEIKTFIPKSCNHNNFNNHSIISVFEFANIKVVIPGDNEKCSFDELMSKNDFVEAISNADILLAPHHGRMSGFNNDFVKAVNPRITVVSDSKFCDTSANANYTAKSRGWTVHNKSNFTSKQRKCLTTASDGEVVAHFGYQPSGRSYLKVMIK
ncbi:ComEC/Rec2 family competence protein [Chondrinema litorale]|uniref:ComEC/Rec2 family competence protein n=1 Tax=Chondrinema litorale TaxID=2994555 RepID=UPI002543A3EC|nr:MBL fold metallo-hydrolase [Chondrinema litorale]UZR95308.1 MBL fold metallo-hydrolase [Chondrinema litorale]